MTRATGEGERKKGTAAAVSAVLRRVRETPKLTHPDQLFGFPQSAALALAMAPRVVRFHDPLALHATQTQTQTQTQASKQQHKPSLNKQKTQHSEAQRAHASLADLRAEVESLGASQFSKHKKKKYMDEKLSAVHGIRKQKQQRLPQNIGLGIKRKSVERSKKEAEHLRLSGMELSLRSKKLRRKARRAKKAAN